MWTRHPSMQSLVQMKSVPWNIIVITEEEHVKCYVDPPVPRRGLLGLPTPILGLQGFPLQTGNPLEIKGFI